MITGMVARGGGGKCWASLTALAVAAPGNARATEAWVDADLAVQLYELSSPFGSPRLERRRFTHTLGVRAENLAGSEEPLGPRLDAMVRARVDADVAVPNEETDPNRLGTFVPGNTEGPLDLMVAYVEGRRYLDGHLGFRLGRQYVVDALGWWSFDGALVRVDTPAHLAFEAYGGAEQRGGFPWSTSRFEADGVLRGDRTGLESTEWPEYLDESSVAPAWGGAIEASGLSFLNARVAYRKVMNRDAVIVSPFPAVDGSLTRLSGDRTSTERAGMTATATARDLGTLSANGVYDVYLSKASEHGASATWFAHETVNLGADYAYHLPTYDADSIFNWFSRHGTTRYEGRTSWRPERRWSVSASGGARVFAVDAADAEAENVLVAAEAPVSTQAVNALGTVEVVRRHATGRVGARALGEGGGVGRQLGCEVSFDETFVNGLFDGRAVATLFDWESDTRADRSATSVAYVLGLGARPFAMTRAALEWEHAMNPLVGQRFRLVMTLEVRVQ